MADVNVMFYHGVRQQIRRVLKALGKDRIEKGLTAFDDGSHDWSHCFFARAFEGEMRLDAVGDPEAVIMHRLNIDTRVPIRIVWNLFDQYDPYTQHQGGTMTIKEFRSFIEGFLDEQRDSEVVDLLRSLDNFSPLAELSNRKVKASCG